MTEKVLVQKVESAFAYYLVQSPDKNAINRLFGDLELLGMEVARNELTPNQFELRQKADYDHFQRYVFNDLHFWAGLMEKLAEFDLK
ncbi:hypothetical protein J4212_02380 [Candidatus Woesearchaeota archaeon]|nr:hypothetical protein [Candidatus Woesearchaeota archaeon]